MSGRNKSNISFRFTWKWLSTTHHRPLQQTMEEVVTVTKLIYERESEYKFYDGQANYNLYCI